MGSHKPDIYDQVIERLGRIKSHLDPDGLDKLRKTYNEYKLPEITEYIELWRSSIARVRARNPEDETLPELIEELKSAEARLERYLRDLEKEFLPKPKRQKPETRRKRR